MFLHISLHLPSILLFFILIISLVATLHLLEAVVHSNFEARYQLNLQTTTYKLILNTKYSFFIKINTSDLLHSLTTQLQSSWHCLYLLLQLLNQLILIAVYFILSSFISWQMTLVASVVGLGLLMLMRPLHKLTSQAGHNYLQHSQMLFRSFYEQLCGGLKIIKSRHSETIFITKLLKTTQSQRKFIHRLAKIHALSKWVYSVGAVIAFSLLLYFAITQLKLPFNVLIVQLLVFSKLMPLISAILQHYQQLLRHLPSYCKLRQLQNDCLAYQENIIAEESVLVNFHNAIRFDKVCFSYHPTSPMVLQQFSMTLKKNTTTALIGSSGIGKTTIADLILGLLEPTHGTIYIDEHCLDHTRLASWRQAVAYVPQNSFLFNATVRENLELFVGPQDEESLWSILHQITANTFVKNLEHGLDTIIGEQGCLLSAGECQRLAIARALLMKPKLLVLDESTNSLDSQTIKAIQKTLLALSGTMTILLISHQNEMSAFVDQVIDLNHSSIKSQNINNIIA